MTKTKGIYIKRVYHGLRNSHEYKIWENMKQRCYNRNNTRYSYYGGRGIVICDKWLDSFEVFYKDMGERPEGMTIDRINNDGNYEPTNCRWATRTEQNINKKYKSAISRNVYKSPVSPHRPYTVKISRHYKVYYLGHYKTVKEAIKARDAWKEPAV